MTTALEKPDMNTEELLAGQTITPAEEEQNSVQSTSRLSREEIIDSLRKLVEGSVEEVKDEVDELKQAYYKQKKIEIEEARNAFIAAGNPEAEFVPMPDEQEETLKSLLSVFREKKAEYTALLEKQREENLERKQQILEEMKSITETNNIPVFKSCSNRSKSLANYPRRRCLVFGKSSSLTSRIFMTC